MEELSATPRRQSSFHHPPFPPSLSLSLHFVKAVHAAHAELFASKEGGEFKILGLGGTVKFKRFCNINEINVVHSFRPSAQSHVCNL